MSINTTLNRASTGTVIPDGVQLVSFGSYFSSKYMGGDVSMGSLIDNVLGSMPTDILRRLSAELTTSFGDIISSYNYLDSHPENKVEDVKIIAESGTSRNYNTYVSTVSIKKISMMRALSAIPENKYQKELSFVFDEGVLKTKVGKDTLTIPDAKRHCENTLSELGHKVEIRVESVIENVAKKAYSSNVDAVESFMKSSDKSLGGIKLRESALLFRNGKVSGKVGVPVKVTPMSDEVQSYLTSVQGLQAIFVSADNTNMSGMEIVHGSEFVSGGADLYRLGVNSKITDAIIRSCGLEVGLSDLDAKEVFDRKIQLDSKVLPEYMLFNFSWIAEEYSKAKGNPTNLTAFIDKYANLFRSIPLYCGVGSFKYILKLNATVKPMNCGNFFRLPRIVDKIMGHYNIMASFFPSVSLQTSINLFFSKNVCVFANLIKSMFSAYLQSYEITLPKLGGKTSASWETDDGDEMIISVLDDKEYEFIDEPDDGIEYIRPHSYGSDLRRSSANNYKLEKNPHKIENSSPRTTIEIQKVVDKHASNVSKKSVKKMNFLKKVESLHNEYMNDLSNGGAFDVHYSLLSAMYITCPDSITPEIYEFLSDHTKPKKFFGGNESKFGNLCNHLGLDEMCDALWAVAATYDAPEDTWDAGEDV